MLTQDVANIVYHVTLTGSIYGRHLGLRHRLAVEDLEDHLLVADLALVP